MTALDPLQITRFEQILARREQELCALMARVEAVDDGGNPSHEVIDFKDMAAEQSAAGISDAQAEQAAHELEQVLGARRRLHDGTYGECVDCGEPIHPKRLEALPATPYCTACQTVHEYPHH
jgi:DnaK suppressor protein